MISRKTFKQLKNEENKIYNNRRIVRYKYKKLNNFGYYKYFYSTKCLTCNKIVTTALSSIKRNKCRKCYHNSKKKYSPEHCIYVNYRARAKKARMGFKISKKLFSELIKNNCHYCNMKPNNGYKYRDAIFLYNGLDRINSKRGYYNDNVLPCCIHCNKAKSDMTSIEFESFLRRIFLHKFKYWLHNDKYFDKMLNMEQAQKAEEESKLDKEKENV